MPARDSSAAKKVKMPATQIAEIPSKCKTVMVTEKANPTRAAKRLGGK